MPTVTLNETVVLNDQTPADILDALSARRQIVSITYEKQLAKKIDAVLAYCPEELYRSEFARLKAQYDQGCTYWLAGYRDRSTVGQGIGIPFAIPADALAYRIADAGYIANSPARRLEYAIKIA